MVPSAFNISVGWAIPVDPAILGARLSAYAETDEAINTFKLCARSSQPDAKPISRLPPELVEMVTGMVQDDAFHQHVLNWESHMRCLSCTCDYRDHVDKETLQEAMSKFCCDYEFEDYIMENNLDCDEHVRRVWADLNMVNGDSKDAALFAKGEKMLSEHFKIRSQVSIIHRHNGGHFVGANKNEVNAYLTIPSIRKDVEIHKTEDRFSWMNATVIDPSVLQPLQEQTKKRFKTALKALKLKPYTEAQQVETAGIVDGMRTGDQSDIEEWPKMMVLASGEIEIL